LKDADPTEIRRSTAVQERLERVKKGRLKSPTASVKAFARFPTLFTQDRQPSIAYLGIPEVSSETREYIPMTMLSPDVIASNKLQILPGATLLDFGILTSAMHMAWMRTVGGRLKSDYSYSPSIYNSFPWPEMTDKQRSAVEQRAQAILDKRGKFKGKNLDDLYDVDSMPPELRKAHDDLDRTVDRLYRRTGFRFERERIELLFGLFETSAISLELTEEQETAKKTRKTTVRARGNR
jgi:hypothetical protein